jgi:hypothetical protein
MIYILTHGIEPKYSLSCNYKTINHLYVDLPESYRMMRGIYKVWKEENLDDEVGIFQYRRRLQDSHIPNAFDVIVGSNWCPCTIYDQFNFFHTIKNLDIAEEIINDKLFSEYIRIPNNQCCYWDNMFIMMKNDFLEYCEWIFNVLFKKTSILEGEEDWLAERLTSFWIWKNFRQERILRSKRTQIN